MLQTLAQTSALGEMETVGRARVPLLIIREHVRSTPRFDGSSRHVILRQDETQYNKRTQWVGSC